MKISKSHQELSNRLNNPRVLDYPEEFLGPNWKAVLNFWIYLDTLTEEQWRVIRKRFCDLSQYEWNAARNIAKESAKKTTFYWWGVYCASYVGASGAICELIGSHELLNQQKSFTFLSFFINP